MPRAKKLLQLPLQAALNVALAFTLTITLTTTLAGPARAQAAPAEAAAALPAVPPRDPAPGDLAQWRRLVLPNGIKAMLLCILIIGLALGFGAGFETGLPGMALLVVAGGAFALAYSGIGMAIALKTGSPQAAQAGFLIVFPLLFLAPTFAPTDVFADWLKVIAQVNPVTYILEGMRALVINGWNGAAFLKMTAAITGIGAFTFALTALGLRSRQA